MAPSRANASSLSRSALSRSYSRQEPSAVVPHAGVCAGGWPSKASPYRDRATRASTCLRRWCPLCARAIRLCGGGGCLEDKRVQVQDTARAVAELQAPVADGGCELLSELVHNLTLRGGP